MTSLLYPNGFLPLSEASLVSSAFAPCGMTLSKWDHPISRIMSVATAPIDYAVQIVVAPLWAIYDDLKSCVTLKDYTFGIIRIPIKAVIVFLKAIFIQAVEMGIRIHATYVMSAEELQHQYRRKWEWLKTPSNEDSKNVDVYFGKDISTELWSTNLQKAFSPYTKNFEKFFVIRGSRNFFYVDGHFTHLPRNFFDNVNVKNCCGLILPKPSHPEQLYRYRTEETKKITVDDDDEYTPGTLIQLFGPIEYRNLFQYGILPQACEEILNSEVDKK